MTVPLYRHTGKQVFMAGVHFADAVSPQAAADICELGNSIPPMVDFTRQIAGMTEYGEGADQLDDNEDAALCLNGLITQARALTQNIRVSA